MNIPTLGLKTKFTFHSLLAFFLVGIGAFEIISDHVLSHAIEHKIELVELTISNAAATELSQQENMRVSVPLADKALLPLVSHLNNISASNYYIWDDAGKLIYQNDIGQNTPEMPLRVQQKSISNLNSIFEIVNPDDYLSKKSLQITTYYMNLLNRKNYRIVLLFPYDSIEAHQSDIIKSIVVLLSAGLLILYILHLRVLASVSNRLSCKKEKLQNQKQALIDSFNTSINALVSTIDARDSYTAEHAIRVMNYSKLIGEEMGLSANKIAQLMMAAQLHDIGKIGMPDAVLLKQGRLSNDEYDLIKTHPDVGIAILKHYPNFESILPAIRHHHERYDGEGYPCGLSAKEIPLESRIIAVADAYDAMTTNRPYRTSLTALAARQELSNNSGTQFDPDITDIFLNILSSGYETDSTPLMAGQYLISTELGVLS